MLPAAEVPSWAVEPRPSPLAGGGGGSDPSGGGAGLAEPFQVSGWLFRHQARAPTKTPHARTLGRGPPRALSRQQVLEAQGAPHSQPPTPSSLREHHRVLRRGAGRRAWRCRAVICVPRLQRSVACSHRHGAGGSRSGPASSLFPRFGACHRASGATRPPAAEGRHRVLPSYASPHVPRPTLNSTGTRAVARGGGRAGRPPPPRKGSAPTASNSTAGRAR